METEKAGVQDAPVDGHVDRHHSNDQLPDWHPFAVWKSQIRSERPTLIRKKQTLSHTKVVDA